MAGGNPVIPQTNAPIDDDKGIVTLIWRRFFELMATYVASLSTAVNAVPGVNSFTVATQPTLVAADAGYIGRVTDTNHAVVWTGAAWEWFSGDASGKFEHFAVAPSSTEYALCDGTATTLLTLGATLTLAAFTTPNRTGTPSYLKSAAAYTGTINAKAGSTGTGTTGTGTTGTGTTGTGTTGTGTSGTGAGVIRNPDTGASTGDAVATLDHDHSIPGLSVPGLSIPGLSIPGLSIPALGVGSIEMANLGALPYVRR